MAEWKAKRFWTEAAPAQVDGGFAIRLDGRAVKTPMKAPLVVPSEPLAQAICAEWQAQGDLIDPATMPLTRTANSATDTVAARRAEVAAMLAEYGATDLLCYRAEAPEGLVERQAMAWDPLLNWAATALDAPLEVRTGVMFKPQPAESLAALSARVHALEPWDLAPFHDLVVLTSSLVIGFAAMARTQPLEALWDASRIDETWQAEQWGTDAEAASAAALRQKAFLDAGRFVDLRHAT